MKEVNVSAFCSPPEDDPPPSGPPFFSHEQATNAMAIEMIDNSDFFIAYNLIFRLS
jgi:hypothetical protein